MCPSLHSHMAQEEFLGTSCSGRARTPSFLVFPGTKWELWKAKERDFYPQLSMKLEKLCWDQSRERLASVGKRVAEPLPALIKTFPYLI